jgi:phosphatidylserine decarboxylase
MKIDRAGIPFVAVAAIVALALAAFRLPVPAAALLLLAVALAAFFRDPERHPPAGRDLVLSPADGRVMVAGRSADGAAPAGEWLQVSVFLSPLDVHVNRVPITGTVTRVEYRPGRYRAAYRAEATSENERSEVWIDDGTRTVVCRQITGALVRRVVCRLQPGDQVQAGDRLGVMKFGSRIDLFLPAGTRLRAEVGDRVRGGETVIAELASPAALDGDRASTR